MWEKKVYIGSLYFVILVLFPGTDVVNRPNKLFAILGQPTNDPIKTEAPTILDCKGITFIEIELTSGKLYISIYTSFVNSSLM